MWKEWCKIYFTDVPTRHIPALSISCVLYLNSYPGRTHERWSAVHLAQVDDFQFERKPQEILLILTHEVYNARTHTITYIPNIIKPLLTPYMCFYTLIFGHDFLLLFFFCSPYIGVTNPPISYERFPRGNYVNKYKRIINFYKMKLSDKTIWRNVRGRKT